MYPKNNQHNNHNSYCYDMCFNCRFGLRNNINPFILNSSHLRYDFGCIFYNVCRLSSLDSLADKRKEKERSINKNKKTDFLVRLSFYRNAGYKKRAPYFIHGTLFYYSSSFSSEVSSEISSDFSSETSSVSSSVPPSLSFSCSIIGVVVRRYSNSQSSRKLG